MTFFSLLKNLFSPSASSVPASEYQIQHALKSAGIKTSVQSHNIKAERFLSVKNPDFFGIAHYSSNRRWCVGTSDSDGNGRGGFREKGNGKVVLVDLHNQNIVHLLKYFKRPVDAAVADNGNYIIHDSCFGSALQGDIICIQSNAKELYRHHYNSNIVSVGLSRCGKFVAVQTAVNESSSDGNKLELVNLAGKKMMFSVLPASGWAEGYIFDTDHEGRLTSLRVVHNKLGTFRYLPSGEFVDYVELTNAQLNSSDYSIKLSCARNLIGKGADMEIATKTLQAAESALHEGAQDRSDWCALAYRIKGESLEVLGRQAEAFAAYEEALRHNPKIGVKRKADNIRKKLRPQ
jgi:hypothetical protein